MISKTKHVQKLVLEIIDDIELSSVANTFGDNTCVGNPSSTFNFNPVDAVLKLHDEKMAL